MKITRELGLSVGMILALTSCAPQHSANEPFIKNTKPLLADSQQHPTLAQASKLEQKTQETASYSSRLPSSWDLSGAIAAKSKSKNGNKAWTASLNWLQSGLSGYQIRLSGPLGSGSILIQKKGSTVYFKDGAKTDFSSNASQLLQKHTGISLPVNNLYYWVRGIPAPGNVQRIKRDTSGHILYLQQAGYRIDYLGYTQSGAISLPSQIRLQGNGVFIKLVIKGWKI